MSTFVSTFSLKHCFLTCFSVFLFKNNRLQNKEKPHIYDVSRKCAVFVLAETVGFEPTAQTLRYRIFVYKCLLCQLSCQLCAGFMHPDSSKFYHKTASVSTKRPDTNARSSCILSVVLKITCLSLTLSWTRAGCTQRETYPTSRACRQEH